MQLGFGTNNYDGNTTLCMSSAVAGYKRSFGSDGPPGSYDDLAKADVILLIGANIAENHPILCQRLLENPGATLIVADPRVTKTAMMADIFLPREAALGHRAVERHRAHPDSRRPDRPGLHRAPHHRLRGTARARRQVHAGARRRN